MPYSKPSEAPSYVPKPKRRQWIAVWNSAYNAALKDGKSAKDAEAAAFAQANGVAGPNSADKFLLSRLKKDNNALYTDTGHYDEQEEDHVRTELVFWANYAEYGPTFDPEGDYLCGSCDMRLNADDCMRVEGTISFKTGSCRIYTKGDPENEDPMPTKLTQIEVAYSERPTVMGFGCSRCEYGIQAKAKDGVGRPLWCSLWGIHVQPKACCFKNTNSDDTKKTQGAVVTTEFVGNSEIYTVVRSE